MPSLANSLAGLSLLSGTNLAGVGTSLRVESRAVRLARAQFTAPPVVPVWQQARPTPSASAVMRLSSVIEGPGSPQRSVDVATAFTAYRALERLRALAEAGTRGSIDGAALQTRFASGLGEVERWLAAAPSEQLTFAFGKAARRAESIALPAASPAEVRGSKLVTARDETVPGLTGSERFVLRVSRPGASDTVAVNLAAVPQPPRLDDIAAAFNTALAAVPMVGADGQVLRDGTGAIIPRYESRFAAVRHTGGGWGLELRSGGIEEVAIHNEDAVSALLISAGEEGARPVALSRMALGTGGLERITLPSLSAEDRAASALQPLPRDGTTPPPLLAPLSIAASIAGPDGSSYAVGTSSGSVGSMLSDGADDLVLIKLDSRGQPMWQRSLGTAGSAAGVSVALAGDGDVIVGGTMTPPGGERDVLLSRFGSDGEEKLLSAVRQLGDQDLVGMAILGDGSTLLALKGPGSPPSLVRMDASGRVVERQVLDGDVGDVRAVATDANGDLLVLSQLGEDASLRRFAAGDLAATPTIQRLAGLSASALAVADDGTAAVGGRRGQDGAVALVKDGAIRWSELASAGDDRIDQLLFDGGKLLVAGRTSGQLGSAKTGLVDAFVARIDAANGEIDEVRQWGRAGMRSGALAMSLAASGDSAVHRLGFSEGSINPPESQSLADLTALRPGDRFQLRVNGGPLKAVRIEQGETAAAFAERIGKLLGRGMGKVSVTRSNGAPQLRFESAPGQRLDLLPGPDGQDALAKLGLSAGSLIVPPLFDPKAPRVKPGGHYGLELAAGLKVTDKASAKLALDRLDNAIATVRAGFRSLYWDDTKAALAEGPSKSGGPSPYLAAQVARYRDALNRLGG